MGETLVLMVDWSASSTRGPKRPSPDRCWLAFASISESAQSRPPPEYFRTRLECEARVASLLGAHAGPALVGFDFPIGYPRSVGGVPVLPEGRGLCALLHELIEDHEDGSNNRFEVAAELNGRIRTLSGAEEGPFWGHPVKRKYDGLSFRKTRRTGVEEYRAIERRLRAQKRNIQSAWKLMGAGAVGSQSLLGLGAVHRLLTHPAFGSRTRLWPFEPSGERPDEITIAEIWPSLADFDCVEHEIKDARQVVALRDELIERLGREPSMLDAKVCEGWILGVEPAIG